TALRSAKAEALDHLARPLTVEIDRVQHDDAAIAPRPNRGENAAVPERADGGLTPAANLSGVVHADDFQAQRGADQAHEPIHDPRDHGNLHPPPARKVR